MADTDALVRPNVTLCRTNNGTFVHSSKCYAVNRPRSKAAPWIWADTVPADTVVKAIARFDYRVCRQCHPITELYARNLSVPPVTSHNGAAVIR